MYPWTPWLLAFNVLAIAWAAWHLLRRPAGQAEHSAELREWGWDDLVACVLAALAYFNGLGGVTLLIMNTLSGWLLSALMLVQIFLMYRIIDPKLRRVSGEFEKKQKEYLEELDKIVEWEKPSGN
ncbi:MAG TPA: hypothetical protein VJ417_13085 [Candidatus Glassbacteria bacterium]|nr:hypothetical protein [Candidatus Glassbacteria bacterium]